MANEPLARFGLRFNPFEPVAAGAPVGGSLWLPDLWKKGITERLDLLESTTGSKAIAIAGEYGSGKTYVLQWLHKEELPRRRIRSFYFDNPGVQFYDLANSLLRQIGRKDLAKMLWELAAPHVTSYQQSLFAEGYEEYLGRHRSKAGLSSVIQNLQEALMKADITDDAEIAHRFALVVAHTPTKPYFEYRDFLPGRPDALVAEKEEAPYFRAIIRILQLGAQTPAVAFLIDEFEEISVRGQLSRRESHDYLATLKRLINLTAKEDFWLLAAMTHDAVSKTDELEPALWARFTAEGQFLFALPPLDHAEATGAVANRLQSARPQDGWHGPPMFPFPDNLTTILSQATISNPRRLIKTCSYVIGGGSDQPVPFGSAYLQAIESRMLPSEEKV